MHNIIIKSTRTLDFIAIHFDYVEGPGVNKLLISLIADPKGKKMLAARHILLCIALLPMWALPPTHEIPAYQVKKCHCIERGKYYIRCS